MTSDAALRRKRKAERYKVDLTGQMACCEANYARLLKLMPGYEQRNHWQYQVQSGGKIWQVGFSITERARYTTMLEVYQEDGFRCWGGSPRMQVRLYHDVQMAEVIAWRDHRQLKPKYDYPNANMYQKDEKAQINRFLSDWLIHNQANGYSKEAVGL